MPHARVNMREGDDDDDEGREREVEESRDAATQRACGC